MSLSEPERRQPDRTLPDVVRCRECWTAQSVKVARVDLLQERAWQRCESCGAEFAIRWTDRPTSVR